MPETSLPTSGHDRVAQDRESVRQSVAVASERGLVYVAGYGRSGSTLLDVLLDNHPDVFGAGELCWLFQRYNDNAACTCGEPMRNCDVWNPVVRQVFNELPEMDSKQAAEITVSAQKLWGRGRRLTQYMRLWNATFNAIHFVTGKHLIVDSSKSTRMSLHRLPLFTRYLEMPVHAIHLVRDPRAVMWSTRRGSNQRLESGDRSRPPSMFRGLLSWTVTNSTVEWQSRRLSRLLRIRYEDLVCVPNQTLARLGEYLNIETVNTLHDVLQGAPIEPGHGIGGNRMRRTERIQLKFDNEWQRKLPWRGYVCSLPALPLMLRYQYAASIGTKSADQAVS